MGIGPLMSVGRSVPKACSRDSMVFLYSPSGRLSTSSLKRAKYLAPHNTAAIIVDRQLD
jgi:hypothetical protein